MHIEALTFIQTAAYRFHRPQSRPRVLEIGSLDVNGGLRHLYPKAHWVGLDFMPGPGVDIVADAAYWTIDHEYDLVLCAEVLEHAPHWRGVLDTAIAAGPLVILTCATDPRAQHGAYDPDGTYGSLDGEHYANIAVDEFAAALSAYRLDRFELTVDRMRGDLYAVIQRS